jgi:hypothetical protein
LTVQKSKIGHGITLYRDSNYIVQERIPSRPQASDLQYGSNTTVNCSRCDSNRTGSPSKTWSTSMHQTPPSPDSLPSPPLLSSAEPPTSRLSIQNFFRERLSSQTPPFRHESTSQLSGRNRHTTANTGVEKKRGTKQGRNKPLELSPSCRRCATQSKGATTKSAPNHSNVRNGVSWKNTRFVWSFSYINSP